MDIKRQAIEELKRQINEGRFKSNNELVLAIRDLYNNAKATASTNPLLAEFLSEYDYTRFTKDVTAELVECYKKHKEEMEKTTNLSDIKVGDEAIDQNLISQVNTDSGTYYTVKDGTETKVFTGDDSTLATEIIEAKESGKDINEAAKEIISGTKLEVGLTGLDEFERQPNLDIKDHETAALARSMETFTSDAMAVNSEHNIILNTESGELNKVEADGKVMSYTGSDIGGNTTSEQFTLSNDVADTLSVEDIDLMLSDPEKYHLSEETVEALKRVREQKALTMESTIKPPEKGFQKILKPNNDFKTSAFVDVLLVALVSFGFSAIVLFKILLAA